MNKTIFPKLVTTQILTEYGIRMTSSELKMLVEERINREVPVQEWNQIVGEISEVSGMIIAEEVSA